MNDFHASELFTSQEVSHRNLTAIQYDEAIRLIEHSLSKLQETPHACVLDIRRMQQFRLELVRTRNALLPVHSLPQELLLAIWECFVYESNLKCQDGVWILAQVSKAWADVVRTSSGMWCDIGGDFSQRRIEQALWKSSERLLCLSLVNPNDDLSEKFNMLLPQAHRWLELQLAASLPEIVMTMRVMDFPALELLEMWPNWEYPLTAEPPNLLAFPKLRTLILHGIPLDWAEPLLPVGLQSLSIVNFPDGVTGPTFSQLLSLLSSVPLLQEFHLERLDLQSRALPPIGSQKPINMPNLCNIRVSHMMRGAINLLLSSIQAPQCRRVVASPLDLTTLPRYQRHLNTLLTKIATFTEEIHVEIGGSNVRHALLSSWEPPSLDSVPFLNGQPGFFFVFQADNLAQDFKNLISFIAYTQTPISLSIESRSHHVKVAIEQIDWDQLPSLRQLKIRSCFSLQPIFLKLSQPRGPRHAMRWPCPQLSVLKLVGYDRVNDGFVMFLANRWGGRGREGSGMTRDPSRPRQLSSRAP